MGQAGRSLDAATLRAFTLWEGALMLVLGVLALLFPLVASLWVTVVVALLFLVGGLVGWINNLMRARLLSPWLAFWRLVVSTLFVLAGLAMIRQLASGPVGAAAPVATLALAIGVVFLVEGLVALVVSLAHRQIRGWAWGLLNGIVTLVLGVLILRLPEAALLSVLGILVGISFVFSAVDLLSFSASFHADQG
ncbi:MULTISPECIES: HdeD family acid-resistance protein [Aphanothece]|uniref:HdeD family acid-resistance protein n=1 Tax=Aphanothece TaxID=1121 RepID=UPI0039851332